jgi:hypothetical protein
LASNDKLSETISIEYETNNPDITKPVTQIFMPFGALKMSEKNQSFEHDFQNGSTVRNNDFTHSVLMPSVPSDSSGSFHEMFSFHDSSYYSPVFFAL